MPDDLTTFLRSSQRPSRHRNRPQCDNCILQTREMSVRWMAYLQSEVKHPRGIEDQVLRSTTPRLLRCVTLTACLVNCM